MILSGKVKEAIKTALAITVAYGIALQMDWDKPKWAGFAVAFVSLATVGQSLNKAALRMLGTLVGTFVALTLIGLFCQERWLFILFLSVWIGFCTYMMSGKKHQYFWNVCGFVCVIVSMDAGPNAINAFNLAILRVQENGLGILVYSLVALLLWPTKSGADFNTAVSKMAVTQQRLFRAYQDLMCGRGNADEARTLKAQELGQHARFSQLLDAAETDSPQVRPFRQQWRRYRTIVGELTETMECWRESLTELNKLDISHILTNLKDFTDELDSRLTQVGCMLADQSPQEYPTVIKVVLDEGKVKNLSHFQKAAVAVTLSYLQQLEHQSHSLFDIISEIKGFVPISPTINEMPASSAVRFVLDPDRLVVSFRAMLTMWLAFLALIYINDIPGGVSLVTMSGVFGMMLSTKPQSSVKQLFIPIGAGILIGSTLYIFVMPQLSSFLGLGLLIFATTFSICYLFASPRQVLGRVMGLVMFMSIASISNQQTYSFFVVSNTAMMYPVLFCILAITAYIPFSPRPELAFLRLLKRFFVSCDYLMSAMQIKTQAPERCLKRWRKAFHVHEVSTIPQKLRTWARFIDTRTLPGTTPQQIQAVISGLQSLSYRLQALDAESDKPQASFLAKELFEDISIWCVSSKEIFQHLFADPTSGKQEEFGISLTKMLDQLESRIKKTLNQATEGQLSPKDGESFYRLLGAYRGLSESMVEYAQVAGVIDWSCWHQERF